MVKSVRISDFALQFYWNTRKDQNDTLFFWVGFQEGGSGVGNWCSKPKIVCAIVNFFALPAKSLKLTRRLYVGCRSFPGFGS